MKLIGYTLLAGFTFSINGIKLPLGFIVFLAFLSRPKLNAAVKHRAAYLGLFLFIFQLIAPSVQNYIFEHPREIAAEGTNAYELDFEKNWLAVKNEFDVNQDARMEKFDIGYQQSGEINQLRYEFIEREQEGFIYYRVNLNIADQRLVVKRNRIEGLWPQYERSVSISHFFEQLNDYDIRKLAPQPDYSNYALTLTAEGSQISYADKDTKKYIIQGDRIDEITNMELPVTGFIFRVCAGAGEPGFIDCKERIDYFYDAVFNVHDGDVTEQEILQYTEADNRVTSWLNDHTGEQIGKEENGKLYLKQDGIWNEVSEDAYVTALKTTPHTEKVLQDGKWHVHYENKYGDAPHKLDVIIDAKTGDILSAKAE
ncbi:hypothetical protein KZ483_16210 [Paenibacillus sp. sptzw28]|uniref:hypothetical protein n=1 Tax=Paenibacillus sp. sptzw28 TaxID=715179 RepID=UPI001C6E6BC6|nr:hypothetical protein [Paenibacillus sp. sptzw28]QYR19461.1 hypothetical protein KZ483_16210 [Paenibacillus sp. sptzw28]